MRTGPCRRGGWRSWVRVTAASESLGVRLLLTVLSGADRNAFLMEDRDAIWGETAKNMELYYIKG